MIPEVLLGSHPSFGPRVQARRMTLFLGAAIFIILLTGCGSTKVIVKENLNPKPLFANAISKAICLGSDFRKPSSPPKIKTFPPIPSDENSPAVRKFVRDYAYGQRETVKKYFAQAEPYLPMVKKMIKENGLPEDLAYLFMLESGANPEARSPANALGMWQFMPATARSYGLRVDSWVDERLDPRKSTQAALLYLKDLYAAFGCWRLALSAYNSGENKLNQVLCREDASEYDEICSSRHLKRETREFFPKFQALAHIAKNPEKYGFPALVEKAEDEKYEFAPIEGSYSLETLAKMIGLTENEIAELNPALVRGATPPGPAYSLRIPLGKKSVLLAKIKEVPVESSPRSIIHVVSRGDNLTSILKRYRVKKSQLAGLNPDVNFRKRLKEGSKIIIPIDKTHTEKDKPSKKQKRLSMTKDLKEFF